VPGRAVRLQQLRQPARSGRSPKGKGHPGRTIWPGSKANRSRMVETRRSKPGREGRPWPLASFVFPALAPIDPVVGGALSSVGRVIMTTQVASITQGMPGEVIEHLRRHQVITLSTSSFTGMPHADTVVYVNNANSIFFFATEGTQMLRNIRDSRHVSFTVDDYTVDWRKVRELQGVGRCRPATEEQGATAWSLYLLKFGH